MQSLFCSVVKIVKEIICKEQQKPEHKIPIQGEGRNPSILLNIEKPQVGSCVQLQALHLKEDADKFQSPQESNENNYSTYKSYKEMRTMRKLWQNRILRVNSLQLCERLRKDKPILHFQGY